MSPNRMPEKIVDERVLMDDPCPVIDDVAEGHVSYVLLRGNEARAVILPYDAYLWLLKGRANEIQSAFEREREQVAGWNGEFNEAEIIADIEAVQDEIAADRPG